MNIDREVNEISVGNLTLHSLRVDRIFAAAMTKQTKHPGLHLFEGWAFTKRNYTIFGFGILLIIIGYVVMALGEVDSFQALTLAPILLFLGYVVVIPISLIYRDKSQKTSGS